jgi:hypothetical protein
MTTQGGASGQYHLSFSATQLRGEVPHSCLRRARAQASQCDVSTRCTARPSRRSFDMRALGIPADALADLQPEVANGARRRGRWVGVRDDSADFRAGRRRRPGLRPARRLEPGGSWRRTRRGPGRCTQVAHLSGGSATFTHHSRQLLDQGGRLPTLCVPTHLRSLAREAHRDLTGGVRGRKIEGGCRGVARA